MLIKKLASLPCQTMTFLAITLFISIVQVRHQCVNALSANAHENESTDYESEADINDKTSQNDDITMMIPGLKQPQIEENAHRKINLEDLMHKIVNEMKNERINKTVNQSAEYYDDEPTNHDIMQFIQESVRNQSLSQVNPKLSPFSDQGETLQVTKNSEMDFSRSDYDEETQDERERLKEEIFRSIQQEIDLRKGNINVSKDFKPYDNDQPLDEEAIIRKFVETHPQLLPKTQRNRSFKNIANTQKANPKKTQYDKYEYYDDTLDYEDKTNPLRNKQRKLDSNGMHRKSSIDNNFTERLKEISFSNKDNMNQEPKKTTEDIQKETSLKSLTTVTLAPINSYSTTLPTPLALESFITIPHTKTTNSAQSTTPDISGIAPVETTIATTTATTTKRPGGKQGKQINILKRKLQPYEKLRNYIEDAYIRMPLAVIVDPSVESLEKTKSLWRDALRTNLSIKIVLVSLNASGAPAAYSFNSTHQFLAGLNSVKEHGGGDAFTGVVHASELVPYDSAVFISTSSLPENTELIQDAAITLLKKRIRLYLIWFGERTLSENETQDSSIGGMLGEVAIRSGGDILHIVGSESSQELQGNNNMILVADTFQGVQQIEIPVDTTLSSLHVRIDAPTRTATLETPYGDIDLKKLIKLKSHIKESLDAYVPLNKIHKSTILTLKIEPENENNFFVFVRADRKADFFLEEMIKRFDTYVMKGYPYFIKGLDGNGFKSVFDSKATTHDNLKFPDNIKSGNQNEKDPKNQVEILTAIDLKNDTNDETNTNLSSNVSEVIKTFENQQVTQGRNLLQASVTRIELSTRSQLYAEPGQLSQLFFEITNTRTEPIFHNIQVVDEQRFLLRLSPQSVFLRPAETVTVAVTISIPQGTPQGTVDRITFTCQGSGTASLSLNLKVNSALSVQDNLAPTISWKFGSRCEHLGYDSSNCAERFWTLDITAQDLESGILRLQSTPPNRLFYRNAFTLGSTEPLKATYAATCCEPKVSLVAFDVAGNQRSYNIDVRDIYLTEAGIAAIVLGCLLLLLLLALLIWAIVICCRRRKTVLDLPTYRSHSTRSME